MPQRSADEDIPTAADLGRIAAVLALIGLAHRQIAATLARAANLDTQALGLIGLDLGLIGVVVAAQALRGPRYWVAIPGLVLSILVAGSVLAVTRFDLGPRPELLYFQIDAAVLSGEELTAELLTDLVATDKTNQVPLKSKVIRLVGAIGVLAATIFYTTLAIVL
jgi:hypothetical protein